MADFLTDEWIAVAVIPDLPTIQAHQATDLMKYRRVNVLKPGDRLFGVLVV